MATKNRTDSHSPVNLGHRLSAIKLSQSIPYYVDRRFIQDQLTQKFVISEV